MELLKSSMPLFAILFYIGYSYIKKFIIEPKNHVLLYLYKMLIMMPLLTSVFILQKNNNEDVFVLLFFTAVILGYINYHFIIDNKTMFPIKETKAHPFSVTWRYAFLLLALYLTSKYATNIYAYIGLMFVISLGFFYTRYIFKSKLNELEIEYSHIDDEDVDIDYEKMSNIVEKFIADNPGVEGIKNPYKNKKDDDDDYDYSFELNINIGK